MIRSILCGLVVALFAGQALGQEVPNTTNTWHRNSDPALLTGFHTGNVNCGTKAWFRFADAAINSSVINVACDYGARLCFSETGVEGASPLGEVRIWRCNTETAELCTSFRGQLVLNATLDGSFAANNACLWVGEGLYFTEVQTSPVAACTVEIVGGG